MFMNLPSKSYQNDIRESGAGFIFLEILIAVTLISVVFVTLLGVGFSALTLATSLQKTAQADSLIKEELEAVRSFREGTTWQTNGLATKSIGSANPYYATLDPEINPPAWQLTEGIETVGDFTRKVVFDAVSRDLATNNIEAVYNATRDDPDTRKVTVTVTLGAKTYQVISYLTNWNQQ
ncbi:MAG: hypothetical protein A3C50_02235 [Candidatus Staskawiczbacteria bacterium RIFCSPHIGHO2_02_FULL_43_16]|uniref:Uncharacterized protein n=1 Tax=Candidatus Staskawiczbacteria bacterium RIFCSPHIGHO2_01_FULL_41_41 TaxID=1802203 RepID=A0A1G2HW45_9BACT|nr:MAG: hypothetical protein A2822_00605 [Candidatus Staskawiczbacteria bacterium RIFCSPHIGHO2_01_FULL_41_41]OGZ68496.1 MAG: hypothetical protein A3C50_02235 [Candidatus Staskawiczbacteria bacterium RIFCSPHIGHO2_02_FULL_43_16]OGZ74300.1 MAG: hypothetical protein A3A12_02670 [Candidatus Staskawiczbacteria bacterium RIFCSPLOWO2_01_FULL_43_17b]